MTDPDILDPAAVAAWLGPAACRFDVASLAQCPSTNAELLARAAAGAPSGSVVVAARQTAGRGRLGRAWFSAPADSLTFSLLWRFDAAMPPAGLSLAMGVALAAALEGLGEQGIALKWPNDVLKEGRKLAGILIELVPGASGAAVIGVGLNRRLPAAMPAELRARSARLDAELAPERLLAAILAESAALLDTLATYGFAAVRDAWQARHAHAGRVVRILAGTRPPLEGRCAGVADDGALLLDSDGRLQRVVSGDVSLRPA